MLRYDLGAAVEAFSTERSDALDFEVVLPEHQAHGVRSAEVPGGESLYGVDALITRQRGVRIGVKTADCVPVLVADSVAGVVAAIHSGWKGTVANIVGATMARLEGEFGCRCADIAAVIGPCIHQEAFEVGDEVYERFAAAGYGAFCRRMTLCGVEKWHIDLAGICRQQLVDAGVPEESIEVRRECTRTLSDRFYSARALGAAFERQRILNCIMLRD